MEKQNRLSIGKINGVEIAAVKNENGEIYVPVKPICEAIGVDPEGQRQRIQRDRRLSSTAFTIKAVGADGKMREMLCLPLKFSFGWIFTIESSLVDESAREFVEKYQDECYDVLYTHFMGRSTKMLEANQAEIKALEKINDLLSQEKSLKVQIKEAREYLSKIRASRLDDQPTLFD